MVDIGARAFLMETYVPELDQAAATRTAASLSAATAALRARGATIELLHSFALLGEEMFFSLFSATTLADVRTAGELAQVGYEQLAEVVSYRPG
jgi:hypothetical protein